MGCRTVIKGMIVVVALLAGVGRVAAQTGFGDLAVHAR